LVTCCRVATADACPTPVDSPTKLLDARVDDHLVELDVENDIR
jgi:hypothetical protein